MQENRKIPGRISYRIKGYDYVSSGSYYLTICTKDRQCLFGDVVNGVMHFNRFGEIVQEEWLRTPEVRPDIELDEFVVMPNHVHGIIHIMRATPQETPYGNAITMNASSGTNGHYPPSVNTSATTRCNGIWIRDSENPLTHL